MGLSGQNLEGVGLSRKILRNNDLRGGLGWLEGLLLGMSYG